MSDLFRQGSLTAEASPTCSPETSTASCTSTSSRELADGHLPRSLLGGLPIDPSGLDPARVSLSRWRGKKLVPTISGISGPTSFASSAPDGPLRSWENRLRARLAMVGSTESALIWEVKDTPAGGSISRLRPWTPPKSDNASSGQASTTWPAPTAVDFARSEETIAKVQAKRFERAGQLTTPLYLGDVMRRVPEAAAPWSTPRASDGEKGGPNQSFGAGGTPLPAQMHQAASWPAPTANTAGNSSRSGDRKDELLLQGMMRENAGAPSGEPSSEVTRRAAPRAGDWRSGSSQLGSDEMRVGGAMLPEQMSQTAVGGPTTVGSSATTGKPVGSPNPAHPCWLQGYPARWLFCAPVKSSRPKKPKAKRSAG